MKTRHVDPAPGCDFAMFFQEQELFYNIDLKASFYAHFAYDLKGDWHLAEAYPCHSDDSNKSLIVARGGLFYNIISMFIYSEEGRRQVDQYLLDKKL